MGRRGPGDRTVSRRPRNRRHALRTVTLARGLAAGVLALGLVVPSVAVAQSTEDTAAPDEATPDPADDASRPTDELEQELDRTAVEAEELGTELGTRRGQLVAAEEELAAVGARVVDARGRLRAAEGQLALAEVVEAEAEAERTRTERVHQRAEAALERTERELDLQLANLAQQAASAYKFGSAGARAGTMAFEVVRRAQDPNELAVGMRSIGKVIDAQGDIVAQVADLRDDHVRLSDEAARTRAAATQAAADAAAQVRFTAELREQAEQLARELAAEEAQQEALVAELREQASEAEESLARISTRQAELASLLAARRAAEEAAARQSTSGAGIAGSAGGPFVPGGVCPVVGAVAGRDFSNDWGYPRSGGRTHQGNDMFADRGTPIVAIHDGVVTRVNRADTGLGGLAVTYRIGDGTEWYNAHLETVEAGIEVGVTLERGQQIGTVGTSGNARGTPPHNHIGRKYGGSWVNPWPTISPLCR
jgi:murein DD-endopeptidase MepM/ murein hydrolase activator NlpD